MNSKLSPEVFEEKRKQCVKLLEEMAGIPFTPGKTNIVVVVEQQDTAQIGNIILESGEQDETTDLLSLLCNNIGLIIRGTTIGKVIIDLEGFSIEPIPVDSRIMLLNAARAVKVAFPENNRQIIADMKKQISKETSDEDLACIGSSREEFDKVMDEVFSGIQLINSMKEDKDANNQSPSSN